MKKFLFTAFIMIMGSTAMNAQGFNFGAKAGVNFASLSGDDVDLEGRTGLHLGVLAEFMLSEEFAVQPELIYSAQGASEEDYSLQLDYISIPVMAKYYVLEGLSIEAGPQFAFNINSKEKFEDETVDLEDVKSIDFGAGLGLGYKLSNIFFQGRYVFGFSDIFEDVDVKNSVLQLSVGYMF